MCYDWSEGAMEISAPRQKEKVVTRKLAPL